MVQKSDKKSGVSLSTPGPPCPGAGDALMGDGELHTPVSPHAFSILWTACLSSPLFFFLLEMVHGAGALHPHQLHHLRPHHWQYLLFPGVRGKRLRAERESSRHLRGGPHQEDKLGTRPSLRGWGWWWARGVLSPWGLVGLPRCCGDAAGLVPRTNPAGVRLCIPKAEVQRSPALLLHLLSPLGKACAMVSPLRGVKAWTSLG